jgi:hypothetical protein
LIPLQRWVALWVAVVIGVVAFATSLILKPRTAESGLSH